jgi:hypothetical protein
MNFFMPITFVFSSVNKIFICKIRSYYFAPVAGTKHALRPLEEGEKYDNYLTKLQNICTENVGEESKSVYESVKSGLPSLSALQTLT